MERLTCGDCEFFEECGLVDLSEDPYCSGYTQCPAMSEVRRLRVIPTEKQMEGFEFMWDSAEYTSPAKEYPVVKDLLSIINVLLDKIDSLQEDLDGLEWSGWSHACSGADCCPDCRTMYKYPNGGEHFEGCVYYKRRHKDEMP